MQIEENYDIIICVRGIISATPSHPFYVYKFGWTLAGSLKAGDVLILINGELVTVEWVQHEILESPIKVYNFEVEDFHTYFVGECGALVHNKCGGRLGNEETRAQNKEISDELKANGYTITGGGGYLPEEYLPNANGGRKGSNYVDITATKDGKTIRINTVDVYANGTPTTREINAANSINSKTPNDSNIYLIPKGSGLGDLLSWLRIE